jgi:hypothetical protein
MDNWSKKVLEDGGFNTTTLTEEQQDIILQPINAPENYYHDGEITANQAHEYWCTKMRRTGLNRTQIGMAIKLNR